MNERGFTLTELLVACAVVGILMAGIFSLQQQGQTAYLWGAGRVEVQQNARVAVDLLTRELRSALSITAIGANCNNATGASSITFNDAGGTSVAYTLSGTTLQRGGQEVVGGVQSFKLFCYAADGYTQTATLTDIRAIGVQIQTRATDTTSASSAGSQRASAESRVKLRNL